MKTKKLVSLLVATLMVLVFITGCGGDTQQTTVESDEVSTTTEKTPETEVNNEKPVEIEKPQETKPAEKEEFTGAPVVTVAELMAFVESKFDVSAYREPEPKEKDVTYYITQRVMTPFDYKIDFNGGSVVIPCNYSEFEKTGWTTDANLAEKDMEASTGGSLHSGITVDLKNSSNQVIEAGIFNFEKTKKKASECNIATVKIDNYEYSYAEKKVYVNTAVPEFKVCGNITNTSTIDDVVATLGIPKEIRCKTESIFYKAISSITLVYEGGTGEETGRLTIEFTADGNTMLFTKYEHLG